MRANRGRIEARTNNLAASSAPLGVMLEPLEPRLLLSIVVMVPMPTTVHSVGTVTSADLQNQIFSVGFDGRALFDPLGPGFIFPPAALWSPDVCQAFDTPEEVPPAATVGEVPIDSPGDVVPAALVEEDAVPLDVADEVESKPLAELAYAALLAAKAASDPQAEACLGQWLPGDAAAAVSLESLAAAGEVGTRSEGLAERPLPRPSLRLQRRPGGEPGADVVDILRLQAITLQLG